MASVKSFGCLGFLSHEKWCLSNLCWTPSSRGKLCQPPGATHLLLFAIINMSLETITDMRARWRVVLVFSNPVECMVMETPGLRGPGPILLLPKPACGSWDWGRQPRQAEIQIIYFEATSWKMPSSTNKIWWPDETLCLYPGSNTFMMWIRERRTTTDEQSCYPGSSSTKKLPNSCVTGSR